MSASHACGYVIEFSDGVDPEEQVLTEGSLSDCEKLRALLPAVAYSGSRQVVGCHFVIVELASLAKAGVK